jgi:OOP family OmpA-OmpF porin
MKKSTMTIALTAALLSISVAQASEFDGMYIGGKAGVNKSAITGLTTASKQNATTFGIEEGYNWDVGSFLVGGDFFADFNQKTNRTAAAVYSGSTAIGLDLKLGLPRGNFMPYVKLGWDRTNGMGVAPAAQFKYTNDLHTGLGVEYKLNKNWSLAGEWTKSASKVNGSELKNDNFTVGVNYYFGSTPAATPVVAAVAAPVIVKEVAKPAPVAAPAPVVAPKESFKTIFSDKPVTIEGANFDTNSAKLKRTADKKLNEVVDFAAKYKESNLAVSGHTDSTGSAKLNQKLSVARAASVKAFLVKKGVAADRISTKGEASARPVADNKTKAGRALNRRVEITSVVKESKQVRVTE